MASKISVYTAVTGPPPQDLVFIRSVKGNGHSVTTDKPKVLEQTLRKMVLISNTNKEDKSRTPFYHINLNNMIERCSYRITTHGFKALTW